MARAEKILFLLLFLLLILGVSVKFYKLRNEKLDMTFAHDVKEAVRPPEQTAKPVSEKKSPSVPAFVDLNLASAEDLEALPNIGKGLAKKIIDYRTQNGPFKKKTDLLRVDSVSISLYKKIESSVVVP